MKWYEFFLQSELAKLLNVRILHNNASIIIVNINIHQLGWKL